MRRGCALSTPFSSCFFTPSPLPPPSPYPSVLSPSHCSRGKPIAGNTSLGSDRKEGRKEGKSRNRGIVTTPLPRARPLCRSCCSFGGGADVARRRGRRRSAGECLITPDFFFLRRPLTLSLSLTRSHTHTHASYLMSHLRNLEEPPRHKTLLTSRNLPLRARPEDSIPRSSSDVSDTSHFFSRFTSSSCASPLRQSSYAAGSSRQLKEVTLYSHARQGEVPQGKRDAR